MHMWQNGVVKVFYLDAHGTFLWGDEEKEIRKIIVEQSGIELIKVTFEATFEPGVFVLKTEKSL